MQRAGEISVIVFMLFMLGLAITLAVPDPERNNQEEALHMELTSPAFENNGVIPELYTCDGQNINPPLEISDVPESAQSLVLIVEDPDVPKHIRGDGMWNHWIVFNISPQTSSVQEGKTPDGIIGTGTGGSTEYQGPCPPDREHRYFFKLSAIDRMLALPAGAQKSDVEKAMEGHIVASAEIIGRYERP